MTEAALFEAFGGVRGMVETVAARPALRHDLHDQQGPAPLGDRRARGVPAAGRGPPGHEGHRQARLQRCLRRRLRCGLRDDDRQRQGLLPARHALHAGPGHRVHRHDARGRPADRPDPRPGLQGEPLLAHPQPGPQEGLRQGQLGLGPDPARQVRDPLPAVLVGRHHAARLGPGRPEDPAVPARRLPDLGLPGEGARRPSTCSRRWRRQEKAEEERKAAQAAGAARSRGRGRAAPARGCTSTPVTASSVRRRGAPRRSSGRPSPSYARTTVSSPRPRGAPTAGPPAAPRGPGRPRTAVRRPPPGSPPGTG